MKYKKGDKVVVEIGDLRQQCFNTLYLTKSTTLSRMFLNDDNILCKLEDFTPTEKKIKMTVDEKKEFDELKENESVSIYWAFVGIRNNQFPRLFSRLFDSTPEENNKAQLEFSRAWDKPSRIEVIKPEHELKAGDLVKVNNFGEKAIILSTTPSVDNMKDKNVIKIAYTDGSSEWIVKDRLGFIKSNAVSWGDGE